MTSGGIHLNIRDRRIKNALDGGSSKHAHIYRRLLAAPDQQRPAILDELSYEDLFAVKLLAGRASDQQLLPLLDRANQRRHDGTIPRAGTRQ